MAIIELFDGTEEFSMVNIDKIQNLCSNEMKPGYSVVLNDTRGITKNKNIEQIIECLVDGMPSLLIIITSKDIIDDTFIEIVSGWLEAHNNYIRLGLIIEKEEDFLVYEKLFDLKYKDRLMLIINIINDMPPIKEALDKIIKLKLANFLFIDSAHTSDVNLNKVGSIIAETNDTRRKNNILLQLGCGFPACMFTKAELGDCMMSPLLGLNFFCVSKVIVYPDLTVKYCKFLDYNTTINDQRNIIEVHYELDKLKLDKEEENINKIKEQLCPIDNTCWAYKKMCEGRCIKR